MAVWDPAVLRLLSAEIGSVALTIGLTFLLQWKKRDFI